MSSATPSFIHTLRIYWEDTDAGGVVFFVNYLKLFERARTEWLRSLGYSQERLRLEQGLMFVVSATATRHLAPARLDDWLHVSAALSQVGRASLSFFQEVRRDGVLLADSTIRIGCVDVSTFKPARMPAALLQALAPNSTPTEP